jgi:iron complex transport system substrate-binding protein
MQMVADDLAYSYKYLSRQFKNKTGYNINGYLGKIRIHAFKKIYIESKLAIDVCAKKVGYNDIGGFKRRFEQIEGISIEQFSMMTR